MGLSCSPQGGQSEAVVGRQSHGTILLLGARGQRGTPGLGIKVELLSFPVCVCAHDAGVRTQI